MKEPLTVDEVISRLPRPVVGRLEAPEYCPAHDQKDPDRMIGLTTGSMARHTTDEGHQLFQGLQSAGYLLIGHEIETVTTNLVAINWTKIPDMLKHLRPKTVVLQDRREWEGMTADRSGDPAMKFHGVKALRDDASVFKVSILKDAQQQASQHRDWFDEMGCHCFISYYNDQIVRHLAPYLRPQHMIRTWHTVNSELVPPFNAGKRRGCLLSGARNPKVYPLRERLWQAATQLPDTHTLNHPGYHRRGCCTPDYLKTLNNFKVAICTSSIYGYCLRKIIEATACGCVVITDLPSDETVPGIDQNLIRVRGLQFENNPNVPYHRVPRPSSDIDGVTVKEVADILKEQYEKWNPERQEWFANTARGIFDYRFEGRRLANEIEKHRLEYKP